MDLRKLPFVFLCTVTACGATYASSDDALVRQLHDADQALLIAVHNGGRAIWESWTTPDFAYVEEGDVQERDAFLKGLEPDGSAGLRIVDYRVEKVGDTAIVTHRDDVPGATLGTRPHQQYLMTETWQRLDGRWKLRLVHVDAIRTDPPAVTLTADQMAAVTGVYRRGDSTFVVRRDGDRLIGTRDGRPEVALEAETRDVFFVAGDNRSRRIFQRDAQGRVTGFVRRDENSDALWTRAPSLSR